MELELKFAELACCEPVGDLVTTQEESMETAIPEYCPDIARIVDTVGQLRLREKHPAGQQLTMGGSVVLTVLYTAEESAGLRSLSMEVPFSCQVEDKRLADCDAVCVTGRLLLAEAKAVTARKLYLRVMPEFTVSGYARRRQRLCCGTEEDPALRVRRQEAELELLTAVEEREFSFAQEVTPDGPPPEDVPMERTAARVEEGLSLPLSALNDLRRQSLAALSQQRVAPPERRTLPFHTGVRYENPKQPPCLTLSVSDADQVTDQLLQAGPARIYLPADVGAAHPELAERCQKAGVEPAVLLPRVCWDRERDKLAGQLAALKEQGVSIAMAGTLGVAEQAMEQGFTVWGDYGLGVYNSQSLKELKRLGFAGCTASFELKLAQIRDLSKAVPMELIAYGRLPLMITENCIVYNHAGQHVCGDGLRLVDRKGARFPVVKAWGCRNEILNAKTLFLADKAADYARLGLWGARLMFTTESPEDCVRILRRYQGQRGWQPGDYTRGLYYRDVE